MGFMKFVIPFVGGALTAAAVMAAKSNAEEKTAESIEVDAEFEEITDENKEEKDRL